MRTQVGLAVATALLTLPSVGRAEQSKVVEYSFAAGADGNSPRGTLLPLADGTFYGTTAVGGPGADGTVFHLEPRVQGATNNEQTLWTFTGGQDGSFPSAGLLVDGAGALYGTAALDGNGGRGTVFKLTPPASGSSAWTETTLWSFTGKADGGQPLGTLIADRSGSGVLYGTTRVGGANNLGVVFSLTPPKSGGTWTETVLASFSGAANGAQPTAALLQDSSGALYGTASASGAKGAGTVFKLSPPAVAGGAWTLSVIFSFSGGPDGATPQGTLVGDANGALYGTAVYGGQSGCPASSWPYYGESPSVTNVTLNAPYVGPGQNRCGVVFMLVPPGPGGTVWGETVLWSFTGGADGDSPPSELLRQTNGTLYGTAPVTAGALKGVLFKLSPPAQEGGAYSETTLQAFQHERQGSYPRAGVVFGQDGRLYGTNAFGGRYWVHVKDYGYGAVYGALPQ